jgi:hypothetical protein
MRHVLVTSLTCLVLAIRASAADLTPDTVNRCKQATALVYVEDEDRGTAFHVGQGLFITNHHLIRDATSTSKITLILDPGETTQRSVTATILRSSEKLDLALFRISDRKLPPSLDLGLISAVSETTAVTAFGFPFGKELALSEKAYPNVTVSMGHITSLRKENGKVKEVQIDASLNPGNSGGPLVTNAGQVIGVVKSGIIGTGLSFAIPADEVREFLFGPAIALTAPPLSAATAAKPDSFAIDILANPPGADAVVTLALSTNLQDRRVFKATASSVGHYTVSAPLLPEADSDALDASIDQDNTTFSIRIRDRSVTLAGRTMRLRDLREITLGAAPSVVTTSGQTIAGTVAGLSNVPRAGGSSAGSINLARAYNIQIKPVDAKISSVRYAVVARTGDKVIVQQNGSIDKDGVHPDLLLDRQNEDAPVEETGPKRVEILIDEVRYVTGPRRETLTANFNRPDGGATRAGYKGFVLVTVKGFGVAYTENALNDAFYLFTGPFADKPQNGHDGGFYQLTFATHEIEPRDLGSNAVRSLVGPLPPYNPSHEYTVVLDTRSESLTQLHFGVSDGGFDGNKGAYVITVVQLAPTR